MDKYAIILGSRVLNVIEYSDTPTILPPSFPEGSIAVKTSTAGPGWSYENGIFVAPPLENINVYDYAALRRMSYPSIGDQLDDLFKKGAFSQEMTEQLRAVKDRYPKA